MPRGTVRTVHEPGALAAVARSGLDTVTPAVVAFGSSIQTHTTLYLRFDDVFDDPSPVASAFLLLTPAPATPSGPADVSVDVLRVAESWTPAALSWGTRPRLIPLPRGRGLARSRPPTELRVEITELIRNAQGDGGPVSLALRARRTTGSGASYSTGAGAGRLPRLELYRRPP